MSTSRGGFKAYNPQKPCRSKNISNRTLDIHRARITQWYLEGWTHEQIGEGLRQFDVEANEGQVRTAMSRLGLTKDIKGQRDEDTADTSATYGDDSDRSDHFYEVTGMPPPPSSTDATSLAAKMHLLQHQIVATKGFFKMGRVFAIITPKQGSEVENMGTVPDKEDPSRYQIHVMLAVMNVAEWCYCIRIRTYGGNGIKHLKARSGTQNCRDDDEAPAVLEGIQKDIDAHAIVHTKDLSPYQAPGEPDMKKRSLAVLLEPGLTHGVIDRMSRACFISPRKIRHGEKVASIGRLDEISQACLWRYFEELTQDVKY